MHQLRRKDGFTPYIFSAKSDKGFTLIELLVVIAIIGVLSAVVLASLGTARSKATDTATKHDLSGTRAQAELFYYANGNSYLGVCGVASAGTTKSVNGQISAAATAQGAGAVAINAIGSNTTATCNAVAGGWAAEVPLKNSPPATPMFCVDYTGVATTTLGSTLTSTSDVNCG